MMARLDTLCPCCQARGRVEMPVGPCYGCEHDNLYIVLPILTPLKGLLRGCATFVAIVLAFLLGFWCGG